MNRVDPGEPGRPRSGPSGRSAPVAVLVAQLEHELDSVRFALEATTDKASLLNKAQGILADIRDAI